MPEGSRSAGLERETGHKSERTTDEEKRTDLRRMRAVALALLLVMTAIFIATSMTTAKWPWLPYLRAFAEAGMVGACADWFAVVALFRHPLGIPIPHTGIVPNNKDRIGAALGRFITNNFLNPKVAHQQFARLDIVGWLTRWINEPGNLRLLADQVRGALPAVVKSLPRAELGAFLGMAGRRGIEAIPAAPLASKVLGVIWAGGAAQEAIERALVFAEGSLQRHKPAVTRIVTEHSSRWIPGWVDRAIAERVMSGLLTTMREMRDPAHPWRVELAQSVETWIADLATDPEMRAAGERIKQDILANPLFIEQAKALWAQIDGGLDADLDGHAETIAGGFEVGVRVLGQWLADEPARQARLNRWLRLVMLRALLPRRADIGAYVTRVVQNWDSATLVDRLELQVGPDLQYIRINGTLVGGLVGLLIFTASRWISPQ
jgi:uncharacterized membrane-anchored protein YjiN (DUF445 family)